MREIGVFDSGMGGVSTLQQAMDALPHEQFLYYGDHANAPYGCRTEENIRALATAACERLVNWGVKALIIACNTTTMLELPVIQARFPDVVIRGIRPAVPEAAKAAGEGVVLALATEATSRLPAYAALHKGFPSGRIVDIPCPAEVVRRVEQGIISAEGYDDILEPLLRPYHGEKVAAIVLGCTHYPFMLPALKRYAAAHLKGECRFFEGGALVVEEIKLALAKQNLLAGPEQQGGVTFRTSGDPEATKPLFERLLKLPMGL